MTMNENDQHICINISNVLMLTSISHHLQTIYFSHKLSFIMDNTLWELLDIDDSNLSSFVYPSNPNQLSFSLRPLIPSPIGVIQVVKVNHQSRKPLPIQEFIMCAHPESQPGFNKNPWLCALEFVRSQGQLL